MKNIGIVIKPASPKAEKLAGELAAWLKARGCRAFGDAGFAKRLKGIKAAPEGDFAGKLEAVVVLGGDGTMLKAARLVDGRKVPILGINMGGLGFLTALDADHVYDALARVLAGDFETEERMMLEARVVRKGRQVARHRVLNDVVIRSRIARLVKLETSINNEYVTTYRADGLIVATPTGSTAYSLSAMGPILYPSIHSIILAPVCPFNFTNRPVVIPDWMEVKVKMASDHSNVELTLDGQLDMELMPGDTVSVRRAREAVSLVKCGKRGYFDILRERLMWEPV